MSGADAQIHRTMPAPGPSASNTALMGSTLAAESPSKSRNTYSYEEPDGALRLLAIGDAFMTCRVAHNGQEKGWFDGGAMGTIASKAAAALATEKTELKACDGKTPLFQNIPNATQLNRIFKDMVNTAVIKVATYETRKQDNGGTLGQTDGSLLALLQRINAERTRVEDAKKVCHVHTAYTALNNTF